MKAKMMIAAALLAAPAMIQSAAAQPMHWTMDDVPHDLRFCRLALQGIMQDNAHQPLRFTIRNDSRQRLRYSIRISAPRTGGGRQSGTVSVDNANAGETSVATSTPFAGNLAGRAVRLTLTSCSVQR